MRSHHREGATKRSGPSRPSPAVGQGLQAISLSFVVDDATVSPPPLFSTWLRKPWRACHNVLIIQDTSIGCGVALDRTMESRVSPSLTAFLKSLARSILLVILIIGTNSTEVELVANTIQEPNRTVVVQVVTGSRSTSDEEQALQLQQHLVFRISLYRITPEGELLPHRLRSLDKLEIHLQDTYPSRTKVLYPVGRVEINAFELFVMFPRFHDFFKSLSQITLVATDQNDLASTFRQITYFDAANLFAQLRPAVRPRDSEDRQTTTASLLPVESKVTIEQLVQIHRDSIGSDQILSETGFRLSEGVVAQTGRLFKSRGHKSGLIEGQCRFFSDHRSTNLELQFDSEFFPVDGFSFDGKKVLQPASNGIESGNVEKLFMSCPGYVSAGLVGGVLSISWPLLDLERNRKSFEMPELEELDGKLYRTFKYRLTDGGTAKLCFDPVNFRHLMTEYRGKTSHGSTLGSRRSIGLMERFSDFLVFDGICLPTRWKMTLRLPQETIHLEMQVTQVFHKNMSPVNK